ncbi:MAG: glycosyl hydrolase [Terriglobia bacterium]
MSNARRFVSVMVAGAAVLVGLLARSPLRAQQFDESLFKAMKWRLIGPFRGGRVTAVAGVPSQPNAYYFGGTGSGLWKTTDGGLTWEPLFDKQPVSSIGSIAVAESDLNIVYVGTGEACIRGNISHGDGVYKSTDAGKTWKHIGLRDTRTIGRVIVHPRDPDVVFVAALGHVYGRNTERGIFRTRDGGQTWEKVLYQDDTTGGIDITFDPTNSHILFAALWEAHRTPYSLSSGGPGSGLYKSTDGGSTWKRLEGNGLPGGLWGRIGVAVSGANPERVWTLIEAEKGGLYRSDDGGETWRLLNADRRYRQRAWYYTHVIADPKSADTVYVLNTGLYRSTDGGKSFTSIRAPHGDHHALWINPNDPQRMINGNDGGANATVNGGKTWTRQDSQPTAQFYHVTTDNRFPYHVYGAQQDNSTVAVASRSDDGAIDRSDWYPVGGCESGYIAPHPVDPNIVYAGCYGGVITRFDKRSRQAQVITAWPENPMGWGAAELKHRYQWTAPIVISPHDPNVLYHAAEVLFKTTNQGMSWTAISPDLTRNDKSKQGPSGGPITHDNTSVEYYDTIFSVVESPHQEGLIWVGTDDGLVHLTRDAGKRWTDITPKEMPEWSLISLIEASPHDVATAYLAVDRHELDDYGPYIYKTNDFGKSWTKITNGLPETTFVRAVREDPKRRGLLYAGTETGVFVSFDDGAHWQSLQLNLPTVPVHDLVVKNDDLVVGTHGRSFWILDDLTPLHQVNERVARAEVHLYPPRLTYRMRGGFRFFRPQFAGENPPSGAVIYYYLKSAPKGEITLEILDRRGRVVRKFSSRERKEEEPTGFFAQLARRQRLPKKAGMNRFVWNLRHKRASRVRGAILWAAPPWGPLALPGRYEVKLTVGGKSQAVPLEVKLDPRVSTSQADLRKQFDLLMKIRARVSAAHDTVTQMRDLRAQLKQLRQRVAEHRRGKTIIAAAAALDKKMTAVEEEILQVKSKSSQDPLNYPIKLNNKLASLALVVESADTPPTQQSYELFEGLSQQLDELLGKWKEIQAQDVAAFNRLVRRENIPVVMVSGKGPRGSAR